MKNPKVIVGLVQMSMVDDPSANFKKAEKMATEAAQKGAKIVALPELFMGPYFCQKSHDESAFKRAEKIPGPTTAALSALAKKLQIVLIGGSIFEQADGKRFNTSCVFNPDGSLVGTYRKSHIPHDPGFYEQDYFAPGDTGIRVHDTAYGKISVMICYDQWFPEAARMAAMKGAELLVYPTAIGNPAIPEIRPDIPENWETMWRSVQVGHSAANNVYVAAVNRVGKEGDISFFGGSFISNPGAMILAKADDKEQIILAECDFSYVKEQQDSWRFFLERRPDMYGDLLKK